MSPPLMVSTLLVAGWNTTLAIVAYLTGKGPFRPKSQEGRTMNLSTEVVRAEVGKPELDARATAWKRKPGRRTVETVQSRVVETPQTVERPVPYAEASVFVEGTEGTELRHCSVCMN